MWYLRGNNRNNACLRFLLFQKTLSKPVFDLQNQLFVLNGNWMEKRIGSTKWTHLFFLYLDWMEKLLKFLLDFNAFSKPAKEFQDLIIFREKNKTIFCRKVDPGLFFLFRLHWFHYFLIKLTGYITTQWF